jgi:two-component system alkaline phosphatase synthesis response regulator PhoP
VESGGYEVRVAYDGKEGLEAVEEEKPDLIVLDVMMPVMNGHEACAKLKGNEATAKIPIILLTAVADRVTTSTYTHRDMLESEAEDYMPKPVEPAELLELIKSWLK